jgi:phosphomethylpyrimidine synthase
MTRIEIARYGKITEELKAAAEIEGVSIEHIRGGIAGGTIVITRNTLRRNIAPLAIGGGLRTKINANIGTSEDKADIKEELEKLRVAVEAGADSVMDLSTAGDIGGIRRAILENSPVPVGTVPVYEAAVGAKKRGKSFIEVEKEEFFASLERHAADGVDFATVHCGITRSGLEKMKTAGRIMGVVSRGGALMAEWMNYNKMENPFYEDFARVVKIAKKYDMVLSLGDGLRPGSIADATDSAQIDELATLGELAGIALAEGAGIMIEGPGHVPIDEIEANVLLEKRLCRGAPFYVLGPLVTDIAPGYDHITSAIGGALAAAKGADFLCYVTPGEHLRLPTVEDVKQGVVAARIAAHAADIAKNAAGARKKDLRMSIARKALDWEGQIALSIDPPTARAIRESSRPADKTVCTMCGTFCALTKGKPLEGQTP